MPSRYSSTKKRRLPRWLTRVGLIVLIIIIILIIGGLVVHHQYTEDLKPVNINGSTQKITIEPGSTASQVTNLLSQNKLIRSSWAFEIYLARNDARDKLKAGTYKLSQSMNVGEIVSRLTHGKVASELVTILPGRTLDQIKQDLVESGFKPADVERALSPSLYTDSPALTDKPKGASLEGFLYPDSFARTSTTKPEQIISESLKEMAEHLTPDLRAAFTKKGLNTYQAITLASIVQQEVHDPAERRQAAQVFLKRLKIDMPLQSDVVTLYGDKLAGHDFSITYDTPYNVYLHKGLPPTPISNVNAAALDAVAHPANTDWLYFVTGRDCKTHFAKTNVGHEQNIAKYGNGCQAS